jgi:leucyl/phenylalanyl-tRNA--protein transferase
MRSIRLDPHSLLNAYSQGVFPMAEESGVIRWYSADPRGIIPLHAFHVPRTLRQVIQQGRFEIRINTCFGQVMRNCMLTRPTSWITEELIRAYSALHSLGYAHSVEAWQGSKLAGGLYGVSLGGAFFGESMYHHVRDASKVALVHLVGRLREKGYRLLDTQANTSHLRRFGCVEIPAEDYLALLHQALEIECHFV